MTTLIKPSAYDLHCYLEKHKQAGDTLYAVVDAAKDYRLAVASRDLLGEPLRPLFANAPGHMDRVGPYLARIQGTGRYREYLTLWANRMGDNAGIFLATCAWPQATLSHLRTIFKVYDEAGAMFYFRYYDPRVIRAYLPTCTARECRTFFGPIRSIFVEGEEPATMHHYRSGQAAVHLETEALADSDRGNEWPER
jgi:hypothetical protein